MLASFRLSVGASLAAAAINAVFGLLLAWSLVRYRLPGRKIVDALVDLPFALPTAVAGIALTAIYAPRGWAYALKQPGGNDASAQDFVKRIFANVKVLDTGARGSTTTLGLRGEPAR